MNTIEYIPLRELNKDNEGRLKEQLGWRVFMLRKDHEEPNRSVLGGVPDWIYLVIEILEIEKMLGIESFPLHTKCPKCKGSGRK